MYDIICHECCIWIFIIVKCTAVYSAKAQEGFGFSQHSPVLWHCPFEVVKFENHSNQSRWIKVFLMSNMNSLKGQYHDTEKEGHTGKLQFKKIFFWAYLSYIKLEGVCWPITFKLYLVKIPFKGKEISAKKNFVLTKLCTVWYSAETDSAQFETPQRWTPRSTIQFRTLGKFGFINFLIQNEIRINK